jgi:hypothetical protein
MAINKVRRHPDVHGFGEPCRSLACKGSLGYSDHPSGFASLDRLHSETISFPAFKFHTALITLYEYLAFDSPIYQHGGRTAYY